MVTCYVELHRIKYHLQAKAGLVESMELQLIQAAEDNYLDDVKLTTVYPKYTVETCIQTVSRI